MARRGPSSRRVNGKDAAENANPRAKPTNAQAKKTGDGKKGSWADPTPAQIEQSIRESRLPLEIALEIDLEGHPIGKTKPRLPLVECGVNASEDLVELQHLVDSVRRSVRRGRDGHSEEEDVLDCMVFGSSSQELQLSTSAVNTAHRFATALKLRIQSLGLSARSLLGDRVLVRLPAMSAKPNSSQRLHWNNVVVTRRAQGQDQSSIQRVGLPPVVVPAAGADRLQSLRHPQLVAFVDELLEVHANTGCAQVVVLRGVPGSGKSTLGREVVAICEARGVNSVVCSADFYFETPRGYEFDVKAISKAHESCQRMFHDALRDARNAVVIVDNTNTTCWEYEGYEKAAAAAHTGFHILEMRCVDVLTCIRMAQRNSHGVGAVKVMAMYTRWEPDDRARVFFPRFEDALVRSNPVTRNPVNNYVAYVGLFLGIAARAKLLERIAPRHSNVIAEHVTLFFRPTTQYIRQVPIGKKYKIRVTHAVEDSRGQAVQVVLDDALHLRGTNKVNHVTVSTAEGISAFYSNELLEDPQAKRYDVADLELEVTLGIAMMVQSRKIVSLTSPFEAQFHVTPAEDIAPEDGLVAPPSSLVVLLVAEADLVAYGSVGTNALSLAALREALIKHSLGPHISTRRVIAVRKAASSDGNSTEVLASLIRNKFASFSASSICFVEHGQSLASVLTDSGNFSDSIKRVTVLRASESEESVETLEALAVPVTVKRVVGFNSNYTEDAISRLALNLDETSTKALDRVGVSTTEEACYVAHQATRVAELALTACGYSDVKIKRTDSALWSCPSDIVDIAAAGEENDVDPDELLRALTRLGVNSVELEKDSERSAVLYFQLPTTSPCTPIIRWSLTSSSGSHVGCVAKIQATIRDSLSLDDQEAFCRIACFVGSIVRTRLKNAALPGATTQLLCERAVLGFIQHRSSGPQAQERDQSRAFDHRVMWAQVIECLNWLASWPVERWINEAEAVNSAGKPAAWVCGQIKAAIQASSMDAETLSGGDLSEPQWSEMIQVLLDGGSLSAEPSPPLSHKQIALKHEVPSILSTLKYCDRFMRLSQRQELNADDEVFVAVPSGVVPGHVHVSASSEELIARIISAEERS